MGPWLCLGQALPGLKLGIGSNLSFGLYLLPSFWSRSPDHKVLGSSLFFLRCLSPVSPSFLMCFAFISFLFPLWWFWLGLFLLLGPHITSSGLQLFQNHLWFASAAAYRSKNKLLCLVLSPSCVILNHLLFHFLLVSKCIATSGQKSILCSLNPHQTSLTSSLWSFLPWKG